MEKILHPGWSVTMPQDQKKQTKIVTRWATINHFWLEISQKPNEEPLFSINVGYCHFSPVINDTSSTPNAIELKTDGFTGQFSLVLSTNTRYDLLDLNDALICAKDEWVSFVNQPLNNTTVQGSFKEKKLAIIGGKMLVCQISTSGFKVSRSAIDSTLYRFDHIVTVRPSLYDNRQGSCFDVSIKPTKPNQKSEMTLQCHNHNEMRNFVTTFHYLLAHATGYKKIEISNKISPTLCDHNFSKEDFISVDCIHKIVADINETFAKPETQHNMSDRLMLNLDNSINTKSITVPKNSQPEISDLVGELNQKLEGFIENQTNEEHQEIVEKLEADELQESSKKNLKSHETLITKDELNLSTNEPNDHKSDDEVLNDKNSNIKEYSNQNINDKNINDKESNVKKYSNQNINDKNLNYKESNDKESDDESANVKNLNYKEPNGKESDVEKSNDKELSNQNVNDKDSDEDNADVKKLNDKESNEKEIDDENENVKNFNDKESNEKESNEKEIDDENENVKNFNDKESNEEESNEKKLDGQNANDEESNDQ